MAKSKEKLAARLMRRKGESIKIIARNLSVSVGSVSVWVRDIQLNPQQEKRLMKRSTDALYGGKKQYLTALRLLHERKVEMYAKKGERRLGKLSNRDVYIMGLALYWGEGFKKDSLVGLATSDPVAAQFFLVWLHRCFHVQPDELIMRVTLNREHMDRTSVIEEYWAKKLDLSKSQFSKPYYQKVQHKKAYENREEYHGVVRIRVRKSINLLREILGSIDAIQQSLC